MRILYRSAALAFLILIAIPAAAKSRDRFDKAAAYQAGYDQGYRAGFHHGETDFRLRSRYNYRGRDNFRGDRYYGRAFSYERDFRKGYKNGYRKGYRDGYRRIQRRFFR